MIKVKTLDNYPIEIPSSLKCYDIIKMIDAGGFSAVFKVRQQISQKIFAAKILSKRNIEMRGLTEMVSNEISTLRSIRHPNIIKLFDVFEMSNELIVMIEEYCPNGTLLEFINKKRFKTEKEKKQMMKSVIQAVAYLHEKKIAHCDIKGENFLLDENFNVKLCDFGFAKNFNKKFNEKKQGTKIYAAPELFKRGKVDFFKSDIWSLGVTLFAIDKKMLPYDDITDVFDDDFNIVLKNKSLEKIIKNCLQLNPCQRPNANDLLKEEYFLLTENENNDDIIKKNQNIILTIVNNNDTKLLSGEIIK